MGSRLENKKVKEVTFNANPMIMALFKKNVNRGGRADYLIIADRPYTLDEVLSEIKKGTETGKKFYESIEEQYREEIR